MQTSKEIVQVFWPDADFMPYPGYEKERVFIGCPNHRAHGFNCMSKVFLLGTREELIWDDALEDLKIRAQMLLGVHPSQRSIVYPATVAQRPGMGPR